MNGYRPSGGTGGSEQGDRHGEDGHQAGGAEPQGLPRILRGGTLRGGIELAGTEVKSIRAGTLNLKDSYCQTKDGEIFAYGVHISPYDKGNIFNKDPDRPKRLLMHKREIRKLHDLQKQQGYALIPLSVYFKDSRVKVELGLCKGKKTYDKRETVASRDAKREMERAMREKNR